MRAVRRKQEQQVKSLRRTDNHDSDHEAAREGDEGSIDGTVDLNYYKENIFNKEDYLLYRAIMSFYSSDYTKSLSDFEQSSEIMHANKDLQRIEGKFDTEINDSDDDGDGGGGLSQRSSQTDLSDVGLCSLNVHEYSFNIVLCHL